MIHGGMGKGLIGLILVKEACKKTPVFASNSKGVESEMAAREMSKAVCAGCGKECEVPFKPDGTRPVYCRECYAKKKPARRF